MRRLPPLMRYFTDILWLALARLRQQRALALWTLLGLTAAATLALSITLYIDAVNTRLLDDRLGDPPLAYRFRYLGAWNGNIGQADYETATAAIRGPFTDTIDLPAARAVNFVRSAPGQVQLRPPDGGPSMLGSYSIGALTGIEQQITLTAGAWPPEPDATNADAVPVLLPERFLYEMGVQVGDELRVQVRGGSPVTVQVAALWRPLNPDDPAWMFPPKFFDEVLLVSPDALWGLLGEAENPIEEAAWYTVFDSSTVRTSDIPALIDRTNAGERAVVEALPGVRLDVSPREAMQAFVADVGRLTQQLVIVVLPVGGVVLYFVALVAGLLVARGAAEDVLLRSRGMGRAALLGLHALMWGLLAGTAFAAGLPLAPLLTALVGRTTSFLQFDGAPGTLEIALTPSALLAGGLTSALAASTGLFLAWRNTARSITHIQQGRAQAGTPWWQRAYLDVLLLVPGGYVLYTLNQQGGLAVEATSPFADPLTFIGPTLFSLGATLLFLRLFPLVVRAAAGLLALTSNIALVMALREVTRARARYQGTLFMMCFTLALVGFTASMANTIDRSLRDTINYQTGADLVAVLAADAQTEQGETDADTGETTVNVTGFNALPVENLFDINGIYRFSRVGRYPARLQLTGGRAEGRVLAVDRAGLAAVTRYRQDFAPEPLADLANRLAATRDGVILDRATLEANGLRLNQVLTAEVEALGEWYPLRVQIVGVVDYFPTLDPAEGFFMIANIDPVFEAVGTALPHNLWLRLDDNAPVAQVQQAIREQGFAVTDWVRPAERLREAQADPSRRGVLGFLSIGFIAATLLTLIGTIIQSSAAFRAQAAQLGALRAMGLSGASVGAYILSLQGINTLGGVLGGTGIGVATTLLFLPLLDFSGGLPPYLVEVAWGQLSIVYGVFAGALVLVALTTTFFVSRAQVAQVARLGDV